MSDVELESAVASEADSTVPLLCDIPGEDSDLEFHQDEAPIRCGRGERKAATEAAAEGEEAEGEEAEGEEAEGLDDVGQFAILCGNWAGQRSKVRARQHVERDLRSSPAHFLILQEAHRSWRFAREALPGGQPQRRGPPPAEE